MQCQARCGMGRDQATSRGSLGVYSATSHRPIPTKQHPNQQQNAAPLRLRRVVDTGPEAVENRISTTPRARAAPHCGVPVWAFSTAGCKMQRPSQIWKEFWRPLPPNRGTKSISRPEVLKAHTGTSLCGAACTCTGWWRLVLYCLRPCVDSPSSQWGQHSGAG